MIAPLPPDKIRLLLGGYATGTLTPEERQALMQAALADQSLFDELLREDALRETLSDPVVRAELLQALPPVEPKVPWWRMSWPWAAMASAATAIALFVVFRPQPKPMELARQDANAVQEIAASLPKPEPVATQIPAPAALRSMEPEGRRKADQPAQAPALIPAQPTAIAERDDLRNAPARAVQEKGAAVGGVAAADAQKPAEFAARSNTVEAVGAAASGARAPAAAAPAAVPAAPPPAPAARIVTAEMKELKKETALSAKDAFQVEVAAMQPDGSWQPAAPGAALPAGRALRLTVTSPVSGVIAFEPNLAAALTVEAGVPAQRVLPAQKRGELALRLALVPQAQPAGVMRLREPGAGMRQESMPASPQKAKARAVADSALLGASFPAGGVLVREVKLKIE